MITTSERTIVDKYLAIHDLHQRLEDEAHKIETAQQQARDLLAAAQRRHEATERIIEERTRCFPWLAKAVSEYDELCDLRVAEYLERKLRPAPSAADAVRDLAADKRKWRRRFIFARNRVRYYEHLFPWLREYVGSDLDELVASVDAESDAEAKNDPVSRWIPRAEYEKLSESVRNQRALDRFNKRPKKPWEIGRDYERYIGYLYEKQGYRVYYMGAVEGLRDLGRDLVAERMGECVIVQCKYWRKERTLREKHVFQLYGTAVEFWIKNGGRRESTAPTLFPTEASVGTVIPELVTSTRLSDEAREYAKLLGVRVKENEKFDHSYPQIKCNVAKSTGEKIYHLPFDQQYDKTVIEPDKGECYAMTVAEAEEMGFRRAWRWKPGRGD